MVDDSDQQELGGVSPARIGEREREGADHHCYFCCHCCLFSYSYCYSCCQLLQLHTITVQNQNPAFDLTCFMWLRCNDLTMTLLHTLMCCIFLNIFISIIRQQHIVTRFDCIHQLICLREKIAGKSLISWENLWFPIDFPLSQPIEGTLTDSYATAQQLATPLAMPSHQGSETL